MKRGIIIATIGTALGGTVLAITTDIFEIILQKIPLFFEGFVWAWTKLNSSYSMPGWVYIIIGCFVIFSLYRIIASINIGGYEPEYYRYTEDRINGIIWRWSWRDNKIENLNGFCPDCDAQLVYSESLGETYLICERCPPNHSNTPYTSDFPQVRIAGRFNGGDYHYVRGAVVREIQRRIRTNRMNLMDR